jgi:excisionase family DNA binding protein
MMDSKLTTAEAAKRVGIHQVTLQKWIGAGKLKAPKPTLIGAVGYRLWSAKDVAALLKVKQAIYRKGRGRKRKTATAEAGTSTAA